MFIKAVLNSLCILHVNRMTCAVIKWKQDSERQTDRRYRELKSCWRRAALELAVGTDPECGSQVPADHHMDHPGRPCGKFYIEHQIKNTTTNTCCALNQQWAIFGSDNNRHPSIRGDVPTNSFSFHLTSVLFWNFPRFDQSAKTDRLTELQFYVPLHTK